MKTFFGKPSSIARIFFASIFIISVGGFVVFATTFSWPSTPSVGVEGGKLKTTFDKMSVSGGCQAGYLQGIKADGTLICGTATTLVGAKTASANLYTVSGSGLYTQYFKEIFNNCGNGYFVQGFDADKRMICGNSTGGKRIIGIAIVPGISTSFPSSHPTIENHTEYLEKILSNDCGVGYGITGFKPTGEKLGCRNNSCTETSWTPAPDTVCSGTSFTQTSNCGNTRSTVGTQVWENISQYSNTSAGAGGSRAYTSITYPFKVHFNFHIWTEDLVYNIRCYDDKGNQIAYFGPGGSDRDWDIDHFSSSCYANKIYLQVIEGGGSGSGEFGYTLTGDPTCGAK